MKGKSQINSSHQQLDKLREEVRAWSPDMISDTFFWYNCFWRKLCKAPPHHHFFFPPIHEPLQADLVISKIQLSGMLLNFRRGLRASWKRYCLRVFHQHSDQYHQILKMRRTPFEERKEKERTKAVKHRSITSDVDEQNRYQKSLQAWSNLRRFSQTLYLFIPCSSTVSCFVDVSTAEDASLPDRRKERLCFNGKCHEILSTLKSYSVERPMGNTWFFYLKWTSKCSFLNDQ